MFTKDFYEEKGIIAKPNTKGTITLWVLGGVCVLGIVLAIVLQTFVPLVVTLGAGSVFITMFREHFVEYDYCFSNDEIDINKIMNRKRRRTAISFNTTNIRFIAPPDHERVSNHLEQFPGIRVTDYTSANPTDDVYAFVLDLRGINTIIYLEPTSSMMDHLKELIPDKVLA